VKSSWEFESTMRWSEYQEWVSNQLPSNFERKESEENVLVFVRILEGDIYTIRLELVRHGTPIRIRGTFTAQGILRSYVSAGQHTREIAAEFIGTAFLLAAIVGSGIMGERLSNGNVALALLANTIATDTALVALILAVGPISGAHLNPAVTLADASQEGISWGKVPGYVLAQLLGAFLGVVVAHLMFGEPALGVGEHVRGGASRIFSEFVATFGLLGVIWGCVRRRPDAVPFAVGAYITAAYWFTASTSFANPAVTVARAATNTFTGIRPVDVLPFVIAQLLGAAAATLLFRWLIPALPAAAKQVVVPHQNNDIS
jgi:glycerol uptake facilitator-like aquaporin